MSAVAVKRVYVRAAANADELRLAHDLMAKAHVPNYFSSMNWLESSAVAYPGFRLEHTRVAFRDGEIAGALRLTTDTIRLGEARLKMGGLGWVTTDPKHRHRGVCSALLEDTLDYMRAHGYHVSMLFGIPNFYHRFGYATTLAEYAVLVDVSELPADAPRAYRIRPIKPGDIPAVQRIHRDNNADVPCSLIRSGAHFTNKWNRIEHARVLTNDQGKVLGYVVAHRADAYYDVTEAGIESPEVARDLLANCARAAQESFCTRVRFDLPPEHPLAHVLAQYESVHETRLTRERGGMMTFVDVAESLENLVPEWEARIALGGMSEMNVETTLVVENAGYRVRSHRGAIDVTPAMGENKFSLSRVELMRLVAGYVYFEDVFHERRRLVPPEAYRLLAAIFPKRNPYVHLFDRF